MGKALGVIGLLISLQLMVARILVITEELIMQSSASDIVGFRLRYCMWHTDVIQNMDTTTKLLGFISFISQVPYTSFMVERKCKHPCAV